MGTRKPPPPEQPIYHGYEAGDQIELSMSWRVMEPVLLVAGYVGFVWYAASMVL